MRDRFKGAKISAQTNLASDGGHCTISFSFLRDLVVVWSLASCILSVKAICYLNRNISIQRYHCIDCSDSRVDSTRPSLLLDCPVHKVPHRGHNTEGLKGKHSMASHIIGELRIVPMASFASLPLWYRHMEGGCDIIL